jgi:hypothetical protein
VDQHGIQHSFSRRFHLDLLHFKYPEVRLTDTLYFLGDPAIDFEILPEAQDGDDFERPKVFFIGKTKDGDIKLGWDIGIEQTQDVSALLTERIGTVTDSNSKDSIVVFDRTNELFKRYIVKKAFEIEYLPADD